MLSILFLWGMLAACSDEPESVCNEQSVTPTAKPQTAPRAVLVYMMADNSLGRDGYDRANLQQMIDASRDGLLGNSRLIVYHDDAKASAPMLKEVTPSGLRILKTYDNSLYSTDVKRWQEVISDFKTYAPARHYGLIFWSHASGWPFANLWIDYSEQASPQWVGEDRGRYMDVESLAYALDGQGFDYIYFDCCHMASIEALYELRQVADHFSASAAELPAEGMPYYDALPFLMAEDADLVAASKATFAKYDALDGSARTSTISVIDASKLDALADATRGVYALDPQLPWEYVGQPFERRKSNGEPCYLFDFKDYMDALAANSDNPMMADAYANWLNALSDAVEYQASTPWIFNSIKVNSHCGLTTYILRSPQDASTKQYRFTGWYNDVASFLY